MDYACRILADSINPRGCRLTTMEVTFPRFILAEFNTHRMLSRNSASSRAIPSRTMLRRVWNHPFVPTYIGANRRGMQASTEVTAPRKWLARKVWRLASKLAVILSWGLMRLGVHKQLANRLLEPFMWHTVLVTATEWDNFFRLRCHPAAQPEMRHIAELMQFALGDSIPLLLQPGAWHLPYGGIPEVCAGRCARVSYLQHNGEVDTARDLELYNKLVTNGHLSPLEHPCQCLDSDVFIGNVRGWEQLRKLVGE